MSKEYKYSILEYEFDTNQSAEDFYPDTLNYPLINVYKNYKAEIAKFNEPKIGDRLYQIKLSDSSRVKLDYGKQLLYFWASWCGPCKRYSTFQSNLKSKNKEIFFFSLKEKNLNKLNNEIDKYNFEPNFNITLNKTKYELGLKSIPVVIIIDDNQIIYYSTGWSPEGESEISKIMNENLKILLR